MGLLDQLWDETVAGPRPDSGLGKLRKCSSFSLSLPSSAADAPPAVTRSITIARPPSLSIPSPRSESYSSSVPSSPASTPGSQFATATIPKGDSWRNLRRKPKVSDGPEAAVEPRSPTVYDWVVISSLDR
ncbi:dormancy-associated protein homolog 3-like [Phragmites australis]|uniref:dormancy-associated protein homolog 3-like n=1 Tax=Phragmites australis TaxID=29695 RepID=UPI002D788A22|nr:dormancy-associated protein homolog 3-like [Phragmites australis]